MTDMNQMDRLAADFKEAFEKSREGCTLDDNSYDGDLGQGHRDYMEGR
mgnify:CR=1 FL=1